MPRPVSREKRLNALIGVLLTEGERATINRVAARRGVSVSSLARQALKRVIRREEKVEEQR